MWKSTGLLLFSLVMVGLPTMAQSSRLDQILKDDPVGQIDLQAQEFLAEVDTLLARAKADIERVRKMRFHLANNDADAAAVQKLFLELSRYYGHGPLFTDKVDVGLVGRARQRISAAFFALSPKRFALTQQIVPEYLSKSFMTSQSQLENLEDLLRIETQIRFASFSGSWIMSTAFESAVKSNWPNHLRYELLMRLGMVPGDQYLAQYRRVDLAEAHKTIRALKRIHELGLTVVEKGAVCEVKVRKGESVLASGKYFEQCPWGVITKEDYKQIYNGSHGHDLFSHGCVVDGDQKKPTSCPFADAIDFLEATHNYVETTSDWFPKGPSEYTAGLEAQLKKMSTEWAIPSAAHRAAREAEQAFIRFER